MPDTKIELPGAFEDTLRKDRALYGSVLVSLELFGEWLDKSEMPFFPEYTEHGVEHVSSVIRTAWLILNDRSRLECTPADTAVLALAALVHDAAMHLSEDGFIALLHSGLISSPTLGFADPPWRMLWQRFLEVALRFDEVRLVELFGDTEPVSRPPADPAQLTRRHRILIGEFLRRYHHRLAHEIAVSGVPGPTAEVLELGDVPTDIRDFAGLVARSHGESLRGCTDHPRGKYYVREHCEVHAAFLMSAFRISDYLDIRPGRAPKQIDLIRRLRSPLSDSEREANRCIHDIAFLDEDPEAIRVTAEPRNVSVYLRLRSWLDGLQAEMDTSWAVLGEIYGRYLPHLGLRFRRVKSNLDDPQAFSRTVDYLPLDVRLTVASSELLKLLIEPLYGDSPSIGIRELIQNAVDAVRELEFLQEETEMDRPIDLPDQAADVLVSLEKDDAGGTWLTVSDRGIGMSPETIIQYFLRSGATFRRSSEWRLRFEAEDGTPKVLRSGRFGIGVLATFLLGSSVRVATRHALSDPNMGFEFEVGLGSKEIELRRITRPIGTTVRVRIPYWVWNRLREDTDSWDWYALDRPTLERVEIEGDERHAIPSRNPMPAAGDVPPLHWHKLRTSDHFEVFWTYSEAAPKLSCNGIAIRGSSFRLTPGGIPLGRIEGSAWFVKEDYPLLWKIRAPRVSVFDPQGRLPLNLQRTNLTTRHVPFEKDLAEDVIKNVVACALVTAPSAPAGKEMPIDRYRTIIPSSYPLPLPVSTACYLEYDGVRWLPWFCSSEAVGLASFWHISNSGFHRMLLVLFSSDTPSLQVSSDLTKAGPPCFFFTARDSQTETAKWVRFALLDSLYGDSNPFQQLAVAGARVILSKGVSDGVLDSNRFPKRLRNRITEAQIDAGHVMWSVGRIPNRNVDFKRLVTELRGLARNLYYPGKRIKCLAEWYLEEEQPTPPLSTFERTWRDAVQQSLVPSEQEAREALISAARGKLASHMVSHLELVKEWRAGKRRK